MTEQKKLEEKSLSTKRILTALLVLAAVLGTAKTANEFHPLRQPEGKAILTISDTGALTAGVEQRISSFEYDCEKDETRAYDNENNLLYITKVSDDTTKQEIFVDAHQTITHIFHHNQGLISQTVSIDGDNVFSQYWGPNGLIGRTTALNPEQIKDIGTKPHPMPDPFMVIPESKTQKSISIQVPGNSVTNNPLILGVPQQTASR